MVPVKESGDRDCKKEDQDIGNRCQQQGTGQRITPQLPPLAFSVFSRIAAHDRLDPLPDTGEDGHQHEGDICQDAVSCHAGIAVQPQDQEIKYNDHDAGGHFRDQ